MTITATVLILLSAVGLCLSAVQVLALARHLRTPALRPSRCPGVSILKPLCGVDDDLAANLASFARLDYPSYEVLLGVKNRRDPAYAIACEATSRWPDRMRVVVQRGEPGLNPKVNQLVALERSARHDVLVISDSNVAAPPGYLLEVAAYLADPRLGLVTNPIAAAGERTLGSLMDNAHLCSTITSGMIAAKCLADFPIVIGKSMALRREDLRALGGFASVSDVLAEDYVLGRRMRAELGKDVAIARQPITAVSRERPVRGFVARYQRWATIQRTSVGATTYASMLLLHPLPLAFAAMSIDASREAACAFFACWALKALLEQAAGRALRASGFGPRGAAVLPLKDALLFAVWAAGFVRSEVSWRGRRLAVLDGTRLVPVSGGGLQRLRAAPAAAFGSMRAHLGSSSGERSLYRALASRRAGGAALGGTDPSCSIQKADQH